MRVVSSVYLRLLIFLPAILIPACASSSLAFLTMYSTYKLNKQGDNYTALTYSFPDLEPVCCSMSSSNCCFLTCIQTSQESGQVVWHSHLFQNFPQFAVIHTVTGFGVFNKAKVDVFSGALLLFQWSIGCWQFDLCLVPLPFLKPAWTSGSSRFMYCWSLAWRIFSITLVVCEMSAVVW